MSGEGPANPLPFLPPDLLGLVPHDTRPLPVAAHPRGPRKPTCLRQEVCMGCHPTSSPSVPAPTTTGSWVHVGLGFRWEGRPGRASWQG